MLKVKKNRNCLKLNVLNETCSYAEADRIKLIDYFCKTKQIQCKMMKQLLICVFLISLLFTNCKFSKDNSTAQTNTGNCFSISNFDTVYTYLSIEIKKQAYTHYNYNGFELYIDDLKQISIKKAGNAMSKINKANGVTALAKDKSYNEIDAAITHQLFCELYLRATN
jgi:hypothetical protein